MRASTNKPIKENNAIELIDWTIWRKKNKQKNNNNENQWIEQTSK